MKGTWLLPTRGRPGTLERFLNACEATRMSTPGTILYSDEADIPKSPPLTNWELHQTKAEGMGDKMREIWPLVKDLDWVGWVVDDVVPETQGWDKTLISGLDGTNIISCNDGARAPYRMHCAVYSGDWLRALGYIYPPNLFWHSFWDDALERLGRATDSWWVCMDVMLRHHDQFQSGKWDETGIKSYSHMEQDKADLMTWRRTEMDGAVRRIMSLKADKRKPERKVANA